MGAAFAVYFTVVGPRVCGFGPGETGHLSRVQRRSRVAILLAAACCIASAMIGPAGAQTPAPPSSELKKQYDEAFEETLNKPGDLDVLFKYAGLATQVGDLEGAISALERMLLINPDLPRVRLELGVLYFRLGSYEAALTYLETALQSPSLPPDVKAKAQEYLAQAVSKSSPSSLSGEIFLGWRYQSNANLGPSTSR